MARYRPGPGRPSAGPRRALLTRLPDHVADRVVAEAEARGMSHSAYAAAILANAHGFTADLPPRQSEVAEQDQLVEGLIA